MSRSYLVKKPDGTKQWFLNYNELHRLDGPALIQPDGTEAWYRNGKCHRENGPALETPDGSKAWYFKGNLHREDGPAIENYNGSRTWFYHGSLHRIGGPAVCYTGEDYFKWYLYGVRMTEEEYNRVMKTCKRAIDKFKSLLRRRYVEKMKETNTCDEVNLYNIIAEYII